MKNEIELFRNIFSLIFQLVFISPTNLSASVTCWREFLLRIFIKESKQISNGITFLFHQSNKFLFRAEFQRVESHNLKFKTWIVFFQPVLINVSKVAPAAKASLLSTKICKVKVRYSLPSAAQTTMMKSFELVHLLIEEKLFCSLKWASLVEMYG